MESGQPLFLWTKRIGWMETIFTLFDVRMVQVVCIMQCETSVDIKQSQACQKSIIFNSSDIDLCISCSANISTTNSTSHILPAFRFWFRPGGRRFTHRRFTILNLVNELRIHVSDKRASTLVFRIYHLFVDRAFCNPENRVSLERVLTQ